MTPPVKKSVPLLASLLCIFIVLAATRGATAPVASWRLHYIHGDGSTACMHVPTSDKQLLQAVAVPVISICMYAFDATIAFHKILLMRAGMHADRTASYDEV